MNTPGGPLVFYGLTAHIIDEAAGAIRPLDDRRYTMEMSNADASVDRQPVGVAAEGSWQDRAQPGRRCRAPDAPFGDVSSAYFRSLTR